MFKLTVTLIKDANTSEWRATGTLTIFEPECKEFKATYVGMTRPIAYRRLMEWVELMTNPAKGGA